jgi:hypothetical protein
MKDDIIVDDIRIINIRRYRYRGRAAGKRVQFPHGRATVIGDERQRDMPLAG